MDVEAILDGLIMHPQSPHISSAQIEAGHYFAVSPDHQASIDLGDFDNPGDLFEAIRDMIRVCGDTANWNGWYLSI